MMSSRSISLDFCFILPFRNKKAILEVDRKSIQDRRIGSPDEMRHNFSRLLWTFLTQCNVELDFLFLLRFLLLN